MWEMHNRSEGQVFNFRCHKLKEEKDLAWTDSRHQRLRLSRIYRKCFQSQGRAHDCHADRRARLASIPLELGEREAHCKDEHWMPRKHREKHMQLPDLLQPLRPECIDNSSYGPGEHFRLHEAKEGGEWHYLHLRALLDQQSRARKKYLDKLHVPLLVSDYRNDPHLHW